MPSHRVSLVLAIVVLLATSALPAAAARPQDGRPLPPPQVPGQAPLPPVADVPRPPFDEWLGELRKEALAKGISEATVDKALSGIQPVPVVVERDRTQAERTMALDKYLKRRLDRRTVRTAREMATFHRDLLARVSRKYAVPSSLVVAIWGLESNFGRFSGVRPTVASLATLAYDNRRAALFREELFDALRILDRGDIGVEQMKGSWAGAMGQPQFMPSTYLRFAEDFDGDGRTDIWRSQADAFASIANFLAQQGWTPGAGWGRPVKVPAAAEAKISREVALRSNGCEAWRQMTEALPWSRWRTMGVRLEGRQKAPAPETTASLVRAGSRNFLVFDNYKALLQYNCAHAYALSVGLLSDIVAGVASAPPPAAKSKARTAKGKSGGAKGKSGTVKGKSAGAKSKAKKPGVKRRAATPIR